MKRYIFIGAGLILLFSGALFAWKVFSVREMADTSASGTYLGNYLWSGTITLTGDVSILGNLTVSPGAVIRFAEGDDQGGGDEVPADGYNDHDPTRLLSYGKTHVQLFVMRKLMAMGTEARPATFTSAAGKPNYADWGSVVFQGDGSIIDHVIVEYSRNGLNPAGSQPRSIIRNSTVRHTLWGAVSSSDSDISVLNNHLYDCGHEGVDVQKGAQIVRDNLIEDCHAGIVILSGDAVVEGNTIKNCGDGIHVDAAAHPRLSNNTVVPARESQNHPYTYQNFSYYLFDAPTVQPAAKN